MSLTHSLPHLLVGPPSQLTLLHSHPLLVVIGIYLQVEACCLLLTGGEHLACLLSCLLLPACSAWCLCPCPLQPGKNSSLWSLPLLVPPTLLFLCYLLPACDTHALPCNSALLFVVVSFLLMYAWEFCSSYSLASFTVVAHSNPLPSLVWRILPPIHTCLPATHLLCLCCSCSFCPHVLCHLPSMLHSHHHY